MGENSSDGEARAGVGAYVPFYSWCDLDSSKGKALLVLVRAIQTFLLTSTMYYPDEHWQATEPIYKMVYGAEREVELAWEFTSLKGRSYVFNLLYSLPIYVFRALSIDSGPMVRLGPYIIQFCLVLVLDSYFWAVGKMHVGKSATMASFWMYLFNYHFSSSVTRLTLNG